MVQFEVIKGCRKKMWHDLTWRQANHWNHLLHCLTTEDSHLHNKNDSTGNTYCTRRSLVYQAAPRNKLQNIFMSLQLECVTVFTIREEKHRFWNHTHVLSHSLSLSSIDSVVDTKYIVSRNLNIFLTLQSKVKLNHQKKKKKDWETIHAC